MRVMAPMPTSPIFWSRTYLRDAGFIHGLGVAVDQHNFVAGRSQRLEKKHPEVRHEIARDTVVGVVKQNPHPFSP